MSSLFSLRIPKELFQELQGAARQKGLPLSLEIKNRLFKYQELSKEKALYERIQEILPSPNVKKNNNDPPLYPLLVETILLLRGLIIHWDTQILRKVDGELNQLFGKNRKKIYEN